VYARVYAQIIGVVLILVGLVGLVLGYEAWNTKPSSSRTLGFRAYLGSDETAVEVTRMR
jgi:hypothetical protein